MSWPLSPVWGRYTYQKNCLSAGCSSGEIQSWGEVLVPYWCWGKKTDQASGHVRWLRPWGPAVVSVPIRTAILWGAWGWGGGCTEGPRACLRPSRAAATEKMPPINRKEVAAGTWAAKPAACTGAEFTEEKGNGATTGAAPCGLLALRHRRFQRGIMFKKSQFKLLSTS